MRIFSAQGGMLWLLRDGIINPTLSKSEYSKSMQITQNNNTSAYSILSYATGKIRLAMPPHGILPDGASLLSEPDEMNKPTVFDWFKSVIITPTNINTDWKPQHHDEMTINDFAYILEQAPEIVLLGTGKQLVFPPHDILALFSKQNIGLEVIRHRECR